MTMTENERKRQWERENPDKVRAWVRKPRSRHTGLLRSERAALLAQQGGCCAICKTSEPGPTGWHGDHDHATGVARGVLCHGCNVGLGLMKDDPVRLRAAADYVDVHAKRQLR